MFSIEINIHNLFVTEPIEQRVPGIVFALESVIREEKITIIEEENYKFGKISL